MHIRLLPMPQPTDGGITVGTINGRPLTYYARVPYADGIELSHAQISDALREAVEECCEGLWGSEWSGPLSVASGLNRRACSKDRVWKYGLPAWTLRFIGEAASHPFRRAVGDFICGIARLNDDESFAQGNIIMRSRPSREALMEQVWSQLLKSVYLLYDMRRAREKAQSRGGDLKRNT